MIDECFENKLLRQKYRHLLHKSGLNVYICPMQEYSTSYAMLATDFGSVDRTFRVGENGELFTLPAGTAHFLEHKMFECEEGDAFARFSATGANANAFTTYDKTAYLFSCTENFNESLEILLDFVTRPYFPEESVEREKSIIAQEIRSCDDSPEWQSMQNLMEALYHVDYVREDIAGTVSSINDISAQMLMDAYKAFYHPSNMVLAVSGNVDEQRVIETVDRYFAVTAPLPAITRIWQQEPPAPAKKKIRRKMPVSAPIFDIGFKGTAQTSLNDIKRQIYCEIMMEAVFGEATSLYREMYDEGLINSTFEWEVMAGRGYFCCMIGGESKKPNTVFKRICETITQTGKNGLEKEAFELAKKATFGRYVGMYSRVEAVSGLLVTAHLSGLSNVYDPINTVINADLETINKYFSEELEPSRAALSVIVPESVRCEDSPTA